jgi:stage V sporulation protein B
MILSAGVLLVKILGAVYKIPLTNMIGEVGMGYFNTAYQLYLPVYTLATAGFPVAVARMVSEYTARNDPAAARGVFRKARRFFLCSGLLGTLLMAAGAMPYARFTGSPGAV